MYNLETYRFGKHFREIRKAKNMSATELAKIIGKTDSTIFKYERDEIIPDFITVMEICNALDVTVNEFLEIDKVEASKETSINPFMQNVIYLYYLGRNHITMFELEIEKENGYQKICFKNHKDKSILFIGTLESSQDIAYINMQNYYAINKKFEKIQMVINLKVASDNKYMGIITGTDDRTNEPILKKCLLSTNVIEDKEELSNISKRLIINDDEIEKLKQDKFLTIDISNKIDYKVLEIN